MKLFIDQAKNMTTMVDLLQGGKPVEVSDYGPAEFAVSMPVVVQDGTLLSIGLSLSSQGRVFTLPATGKVVSSREVEPGNFQVRIQLRQFDGALWAQILAALSGDQKRVDKLFDAMKGTT